VFAVEIDGDNWILRVAAARVVPRVGTAAESLRNGERDTQQMEAEEGPMRPPKMNTSSSSSDRWI
jgi:hypothetical protein